MSQSIAPDQANKFLELLGRFESAQDGKDIYPGTQISSFDLIKVNEIQEEIKQELQSLTQSEKISSIQAQGSSEKIGLSV